MREKTLILKVFYTQNEERGMFALLTIALLFGRLFIKRKNAIINSPLCIVGYNPK